MSQGMQTADWALVLSIFSFIVSLAGFIWNVWSKFIYPRAKVRASIAVMQIIQRGTQDRTIVTLSATNYGPTDVTLHAAITKMRPPFWRFKRNTRLAVMQPYDDPDSKTTSGPFSGGLPKKVAVGEQFAVHFPVTKGWAEKDIDRYGFSDTFGRYHWCARRTAKEFHAALLKEGATGEPGARPGKR
jgi:hypothetical protein